MSRKDGKTLLVIAVLAFCLRAAFIATLGDELVFPDSHSYDRIARDLLEGRGYTSTTRPPLYPLFLAGAYSVSGRGLTGARLLQAAVECLSAALVFLLARRVFGARTGLLAAAVFAAYPLFIYFSGLILSETLFIFLLLLLVLLLARYAENPSPGAAALYGAAGGLCLLVKPAAALFVPAAIAAAAFRRGGAGRALAGAAVAAGCALAVASPWAAGNYARHGRAALLTTGGGITLYESFNPRADGGPGQEHIEMTGEIERMDAFEQDAYFRRKALEFIRDNPGRALALVFPKQARFWSPVPNEPAYRRPAYMAASFFSYTPVLVLALLQAFSGRRKRRETLLLLLPVIFFALVHTVILGSLRYRVPTDPFLIILASEKICSAARPRLF